MMASPTTDAWQSYPTGVPPTAPRTGPFPHRSFLATVWRHRPVAGADLQVTADSTGAVALAVSDEVIAFVGDEDVTDYHSPLGAQPAATIVAALEPHAGRPFRFDSLPAEALASMTDALDTLDASFSTRKHDVAAVLALPETFDDWLSTLGKKERHEVRRKRRKLESLFGETTLTSDGSEALDRFVTMHRGSIGDKGSFMTDETAAFFADLVAEVGAVIHTLRCDGRPVAAAFGFETDTGYYYYNAAFDMEASAGSPGVVLLSTLIEAQITRGASVFDFLKGDEAYKFRHGGEARDLFIVEGRLR